MKKKPRETIACTFKFTVAGHKKLQKEAKRENCSMRKILSMAVEDMFGFDL